MLREKKKSQQREKKMFNFLRTSIEKKGKKDNS